MEDVIVIGAGVVGCSIARSLSRYDLKVRVLEAGSDVAEGATKANSAIVHAGFDAKPGTSKAKFNLLGNRMFAQVCAELKVPFKPNGSLVLAFSEEDKAELQKLLFEEKLTPALAGVARVNREDGVKLYFEDGSWVICRFSGTEPLLRMAAEAERGERAEAYITAWKELLGL